MGDRSLVGIAAVVAGEKDPRNLMLVFSMLRAIMVEWDITRHVDIMFDSVYAYFPITFRPPPNDPYGITAQDLKDRLRDCLASTGALAPHTMPNLLDRLDSTSITVKKDVLSALAACALRYDPSTVSQYSITLWDAVKFEVLQAQEPELADEALTVLGNIAATLTASQAETATSSPLNQYLKPVVKECLEHLEQPASRQAKASGDIIQAVASASIPSFEYVAKSLGPALLKIHQAADATLQQRAILEVTNKLFEAACTVYGTWITLSSKNSSGRENILNEFKDSLVAIYSQALMGTVKEEVSFRLTAAKGLLLLSKMRSLLLDNEIGLIVQYYDDIILKEESYGKDELKETSMKALAEISSFKSRLIADITFPAIMAKLPDNEDDAKSADYRSVLEALAEISVEKELLETMMRRLLNKLDILFRTEGYGRFPYTCAVLGTIRYVLKRTVDSQAISLAEYFDRVVAGLSRLATGAKTGALADEVVLDTLGRVMNIIVRNSSNEKVQKAAENTYPLFRDFNFSNQDVRLQALFDTPASVILSTWLLAALPRSLNVGILTSDRIALSLEDLVLYAENSKSQTIEVSCLRQIALYINKHLSNPDLDIADSLLSSRMAALQQPSASAGFNLRLCFFVTKALVLRLAPKTNQYLENLIDLLKSPSFEVCRQSALLFRVILAADDVVSKENNAQIRLLAPQRVFQSIVPSISARFRASQSGTEKENYLVALSGILSTVPSAIVMPELPTLLPLLLQSLDIADQSVKIATLETLAVVIANNPAALEESGHIPALSKRLLSSATVSKDSSAANNSNNNKSTQSLPRTRRLATRCLALLPKHISAGTSRANPLLALKRDVLQGLMAVLDDERRDVRKEAVDARAAWLRGVDDVDDEDEE
jgi:DNA repair/transcription protein MET18/MMS19